MHSLFYEGGFVIIIGRHHRKRGFYTEQMGGGKRRDEEGRNPPLALPFFTHRRTHILALIEMSPGELRRGGTYVPKEALLVLTTVVLRRMHLWLQGVKA